MNELFGAAAKVKNALDCHDGIYLEILALWLTLIFF